MVPSLTSEVAAGENNHMEINFNSVSFRAIGGNYSFQYLLQPTLLLWIPAFEVT